MTHKEIVSRVQGGARFRIDFKRRTVTLDGRKVKYEAELPVFTNHSAMELCEMYYRDYKHSRPTERSMQRRRPYFRALPLGELSDNDMNFGMSRDVAQCSLELVVLALILNGSFLNEAHMGWFWTGEDKDFVMRRSWCESNS